MSKQKLIFLVAIGLLGLVAALAPLLPSGSAQQSAPSRNDVPEAKSWQAVAPGRVEPRSEQIRIGSPLVGRVGEVLVKINDTVFAGEPLIRIDGDEVRTRLTKAETEVSFRKRGRANPPPPKDAARRKVEDAAADAERAVVAARAVADGAAAARRAGTGSGDALTAALTDLSGAREQLKQRQAELAQFEASMPPIVPTELEGQLAMALVDLRGAEAAIDNLTIRAPIAGTVLQLGIKAGELASPSAPQALVVMGDLSALRIRAELDERDFGAVKIGQPVLVRSAAFPGRDFAGKVASISQVIGPGNYGARGRSNFSDIDVAEVMVELAEPGPLIVGMKVDAYFRRNDP